ncbi:hypothetical protein GH733_013233 [Mirounga leonina]|nr:hypothetical protein GH733_013233 [Mirounga leonina]
MVMEANKKSQDQMTEDLSLFLGNTIRFILCLHGVLNFALLKSSDTNIFDNTVSSNKSSFSRGDESMKLQCHPLENASTEPEKKRFQSFS